MSWILVVAQNRALLGGFPRNGAPTARGFAVEHGTENNEPLIECRVDRLRGASGANSTTKARGIC